MKNTRQDGRYMARGGTSVAFGKDAGNWLSETV